LLHLFIQSKTKNKLINQTLVFTSLEKLQALNYYTITLHKNNKKTVKTTLGSKRERRHKKKTRGENLKKETL